MSNDFLPFAVGGSANVTAQATYAANTTLTQNGFVAGIAKSPDLNKVWRQSSIMAAVLAQFITNTTGQNAVDDGTTATLLANLISAVSAQSESIVGGVRNLSMTVSAASATATMTADEIIVGSALGGLKYTLANFSKTINLATTGAGGMDTGTAPVSGFVALYAIWNPTTSTAALLAQNASTLKPNVYGGANMPAGYTASALISVWPTTAGSLLGTGLQRDRRVNFPLVLAFSTLSVLTGSSASLAGFIPANAVRVGGELNISNTAASFMTMAVSIDANHTGQQAVAASVPASQGIADNYFIDIATPQTVFLFTTNVTGTSTFSIFCSSYEI
jgi:hypothetical protein